ncbi:MAG: hypothetical protein DI630_30480 [Gordonia sp. (in: high G+C Gram-positive bacteria)]|nr:MAG: hypothetical protein DI630_30480 [Gordonia sp. (in: high G+C Gram-positive bacteria)]
MAEAPAGSALQNLNHLFGPSASVPTALPPQPAAVADTQHPGATEAVLSILDVAVLTGGTEVNVERHILDLVAAGLRRPVDEITGEEYVEGTEIALDSMTAVFVCTVIVDALGRNQIRTLRGNCRPNDFSSTRSVAQLVCRLRLERVSA